MTQLSDKDRILVIIDCDGVLTDYKNYYTSSGKLLKVFDSRDSYTIKKMLREEKYEILVLTADSKGYPIIAERAKDWGVSAYQADDKLKFIKQYVAKNSYKKIVFVANGPEDAAAIEAVDELFVTKDARPELIGLYSKKIRFLETKGGDGVMQELYTILGDSHA